MNGSPFTIQHWLLPIGMAVFALSVIAAVAPRHQHAQLQAEEISKSNKNVSAPSADQQYMTPADRALTQKIRKAIHHDKTLSNYGKNIKILTQYGKVTLRGPVQSEQEKLNLHAKAVDVAGQANVTNQLEIAPMPSLPAIKVN